MMRLLVVVFAELEWDFKYCLKKRQASLLEKIAFEELSGRHIFQG